MSFGIIQNVQRVILVTVPSGAFHQHMERTVNFSAIVQTVILLMGVLIWIGIIPKLQVGIRPQSNFSE